MTTYVRLFFHLTLMRKKQNCNETKNKTGTTTYLSQLLTSNIIRKPQTKRKHITPTYCSCRQIITGSHLEKEFKQTIFKNSHITIMSGRGRGISNAPAWMTRAGGGDNSLGNNGIVDGGDPPNGLPPPPMGMNHNQQQQQQERDAFGRVPRGGHPGQQGPPHHQQQQQQQPFMNNNNDRRHGSMDDRRGGRGSFNNNDGDRWEGRGAPPGGGGRRGDNRGGRDNRDNRHRGGDNRGGDGGGGNRGGDNNNRRGSGGGGRNDNINSSSSREQLNLITFRSYEEEQDWVDERRRKRKARPSKFDVEPTPQQLAADAAVKAISANPAATDFAGIPKTRDFSAVPQQTRHARRLYIGHLPPNVDEQELHVFFRGAIEQALSGNNNNNQVDPILSVYINHERRFCFLEFREVAMATVCMALDGINISGKGKVKVKRPNDYNPTMAPPVHPSSLPVLDVSKLGIISCNVADGPNKLFIGGLHYHLAENQVLELLGAFGKIKSFHLVKNEPDSPTSKGYCFVEYADPNSTPVAVMGLNGMDMGGGKVLTARVAGQRGQPAATIPNGNVYQGGASGQQFPPQLSNLSNTNGVNATAITSSSGSTATIVNGYEIEHLVDAALGLKPMPTQPTHVDQFGIPITQMGSGIMTASGGPPPPPPPQQQQSRMPPVSTMAAPGLPSPQVPGTLSSALDIANAAQAALDAAFGTVATVPSIAPPQPPQQPPQQTKTRILVLLNMVSDEDLQTDEDYSGLMEEVEEEVRKFGKLLSMQIPRYPTSTIEASSIRKIYLEYATNQDSANAENELAGRQFGPNVVEASYYDEQEYALLKLR